MSIKLEVGKTYLNRFKQKITIHKYKPSYVFPFIGVYPNGDEEAFKEDGSWAASGTSIKDLICEIEESDLHNKVKEVYTKEQILKAIELARGYSNDEILKMIQI